MNKNLEIVVARYSENLEWLKPYQSVSKVYNKGDPTPGVHSISLPNIGREGHTYLHHIINNYDSLAERTIFCQGDPFEHSPDFLDLLDAWQQHLPVQALNWRWIEHDSNRAKPTGFLGRIAALMVNNHKKFGIPPLSIREKYTDSYLGSARIFVDILGPDMIPVYPVELSEWSRAQKNSIDFIACNGRNTLNELWTQLKLGGEPPLAIHSNVAAQFSVARESILSHPARFYQGLMDFLLSDKTEVLRHGILLERLWLAIFRYSHFNPNVTMPEELHLVATKND